MAHPRPATSNAPSRPSLSASIELLKPITWFAPMWAYACGVISSGQTFDGRWGEVLLGVILAGPLVCGTSQAVNDWYDRHVDAINEPDRPIPSGRIPGRWGLYIGVAWTGLSLAVASLLGVWAFIAACVGLALAWAYSAPPFRLKQEGWRGCTAVAACYEGLPWFTGAAVMASALPDWRICLIAALYSVGAVGIMTLNDFKAIEGDKRMGIRSLPVQLGVAGAAWVACLFMAVPQAIVAGLMFVWGAPWHALAIIGVLAVQLVLMKRLLADPAGQAPFYNATGTLLYVIGMMVAAFALAGLQWGTP
ncbi:MAG: chlorophyll synthase ChlG [Alphaproteobacteria bacterium]|nr:chlorophyll synthase ChlG [Alphaproteobacteria bacterium]